MKRVLILFAALVLAAGDGGVANANLLANGALDVVGGGDITGWSRHEYKTFSGDSSDFITLEPWPEVGPITNGGGDADQAGFVKAFQGNPTSGDLASLDFWQDVAGTPGMKYILTGWIGAGVNYSGLLAGPTQTLLAIDFDNDNIQDNGVIGSVVTDVKAAGLAAGAFPEFGGQEFMAMGIAPAGTSVVRARFSALDMYSTVNPDQAAFIDDFTLICVPEPTTLALVGLGLVGLVGIRRRSS